MCSLEDFLNDDIMQDENLDDMGATGRSTARQVNIGRTTLCGPPVTALQSGQKIEVHLVLDGFDADYPDD